jgi:hypothetical protein
MFEIDGFRIKFEGVFDTLLKNFKKLMETSFTTEAFEIRITPFLEKIEKFDIQVMKVTDHAKTLEHYAERYMPI